MSNIIDNIGHALEKAKDYVEEHPWQAAAAAAVGAGALLGPGALAGAAVTEAAVARGLLPALTMGEAAVGAEIIAGTAGGVGGALIGEAGLFGMGFGLLAGAAAAKAAAEVAQAAAAKAKPAEATTQPTTQPAEVTTKSAK